MELPFNMIAVLTAALIFILIVVAFAYLTKKEGEDVLDRIWNLGCFIEDIMGKQEADKSEACKGKGS